MDVLRLEDLGDGGFEVSWDDPDGGPETSVCNAEEMRCLACRKKGET